MVARPVVSRRSAEVVPGWAADMAGVLPLARILGGLMVGSRAPPRSLATLERRRIRPLGEEGRIQRIGWDEPWTAPPRPFRSAPPEDPCFLRTLRATSSLSHAAPRESAVVLQLLVAAMRRARREVYVPPLDRLEIQAPISPSWRSQPGEQPSSDDQPLVRLRRRGGDDRRQPHAKSGSCFGSSDALATAPRSQISTLSRWAVSSSSGRSSASSATRSIMPLEEPRAAETLAARLAGRRGSSGGWRP
jgi:hypothetical protein